MLMLPQMSRRLSLQDVRFGVILEGKCNQGMPTLATLYPKTIKDNGP